MLGIGLRILSVIGIILLVLLALLLAVILLILFFPVTYHVYGSKSEKELKITARAKWLFGLVRMKYNYPEPGRVVVKALWFSLYDSGSPPEEKEEKDTGKRRASKVGKEKRDASSGTSAERKKESPGDSGTEKPKGLVDSSERVQDSPGTEKVSAETASDFSGGEEVSAEAASDSPGTESTSDNTGGFFQKFKKIKYTIRSIYDKIKEIWENISYYMELLREEDTRQLFAHVWLRLGRILRNIRPRHVMVEILFGTGSPDTTGYAYGAYCMLASALGKGFYVTPDFERAVFQAEFDVSGHITLWVLSVNALKLFLDKRLKAFIGKCKKTEKKKA